MSDFKNQWDMQMALKVLQSETIDAETWGEAVKWLLLYGPPEIQTVLQQASSVATNEYFPDLKPKGYTDNGEPCFDVRDIAENLGISKEKAAEELIKLERKHGVRQLLDKDETQKIH